MKHEEESEKRKYSIESSERGQEQNASFEKDLCVISAGF
jgi:hypothetical protein